MELLETKVKSANPIPVMGVESEPVQDDEDRVSRVAVAAYYKSEARGYEPGHEIQDWLEAEAEIDKGKSN